MRQVSFTLLWSVNRPLLIWPPRRYGSCGQYERNVTAGPLVPSLSDQTKLQATPVVSKTERLLSLKAFRYMSNAITFLSGCSSCAVGDFGSLLLGRQRAWFASVFGRVVKPARSVISMVVCCLQPWVPGPLALRGRFGLVSSWALHSWHSAATQATSGSLLMPSLSDLGAVYHKQRRCEHDSSQLLGAPRGFQRSLSSRGLGVEVLGCLV